MAITLSAIAEFEAKWRRERQTQGILLAKKKGKYTISNRLVKSTTPRIKGRSTLKKRIIGHESKIVIACKQWILR